MSSGHEVYANYECSVHRYNRSSLWDKLASFPGSCAVEEEKRNEARDMHEQAIDASSFEPRLSVSELVSQLGKKIAFFS